ncbi:MAG: hypothetical protein EP330_11495 [Deltaproteobacteria bacterium]|nr:MAG: hypothetical protein EP330_11495 [Deltaproteobacteria bacterium]
MKALFPILLLLSLTAVGGELPPLPEDPGEAWAVARQDWLPELEARQQRAEARAKDARAYFAGQMTLTEAFPSLRDASLLDAAVIRAHLRALDESLKARVPLRSQPLPDLGATDRGQRVLDARTRALDAEDEAEALERRLLVARLAFVEDHPSWVRSGEEFAAPLDRFLADARERAKSEDPAVSEPALDEVAALDRELAAIRAWSRALADRAASGQAELPELALEGLQTRWGEHTLARLAAIEAVLPGTVPDLAAYEVAWIDDHGIPALQRPLPAVPSDLTGATARARSDLATARAKVPSDAGEDALAQARHRLAEARVARAERWLTKLEDQASSEAETEAERARVEADRAREEADSAREQADDAAAIAAAEARARAAHAQERAAEDWERTRALEQALTETRAERLKTFTALSGKVDAILHPVLGQELPNADSVYADIRTLIADLRSDASLTSERERELSAERSETATVLESERRQVEVTAQIDPPLADRWSRALEDQVRAQTAAHEAHISGRDSTMLMLGEAKELRRELSGYVSSAQRALDRADLIENVGQELGLAGANLAALARDRVGAIASLPGKAKNLDFLWTVTRGSALTLLLTALWWMARNRTEDGTRELLVRIRKQFPVRPADLRTLREPLNRVLRYGLDLLAGWLLREPLAALAPELGLIVLVWLQVALFRFVLATFEVLVIRHPERRPSWLVLGEDAHSLARRSLRYALIWWIAKGLLISFALSVLRADAVAEALGMLFSAAGFALIVWALHSWHPHLLRRVQRLHQGSRAVRILSTPPHWLLQVPHSLAMIAYLSAALAWDLLDRLARRQEGVGRLFNAVSRYRLGQEQPTAELHELPAEVLDGIRNNDKALLRRQATEESLLKCIGAWQKERRRGLIALVGDRGEGKGVLLDQLAPNLELDGRPSRRILLTQRIRSERDAMKWLASALELPRVPKGPDDAVELLEALEPTLLVVEDLHLAFLRTVGGFEGLNALLFAFNASSDHHFWLVTVHSPAWRYLTRLGGMVDTGIFREVVTIPALGEEELRELTQRRLSIAGYKPDFSPLVRTNPFGTDPEVELERTTSVFYRLLAEASNGNPAVALHLFADCLSAAPGEQGVALVRMRRTLTGNVDGLTDPELFALTAIRTQARLTLDELVEVTNMGRGPLRQIVKNLQSQGLLRSEGEHISIPGIELPAVTRTLRRRHFLYGGS